MEKKEHSFRASFLAILSGTGCMHSKRLDGSKFAHACRNAVQSRISGTGPAARRVASAMSRTEHTEKPRAFPASAPGEARKCPYGPGDPQALSAFQPLYPGIRVDGICGLTRLLPTLW